jgi:hypothetical protein
MGKGRAKRIKLERTEKKKEEMKEEKKNEYNERYEAIKETKHVSILVCS